ncbi:MAG: hypothetical protein U9Q69_00780 [Nanoarchaeota archaeon]|nr:hypothetical protein [Nanoarchaeota archaeon]
MEDIREMVIKFSIKGTNIQTQVQTKQVSPQEALGLLDMAKHQILDNLAKDRKELFSGSKTEEKD